MFSSHRDSLQLLSPLPIPRSRCCPLPTSSRWPSGFDAPSPAPPRFTLRTRMALSALWLFSFSNALTVEVTGAVPWGRSLRSLVSSISLVLCSWSTLSERRFLEICSKTVCSCRAPDSAFSEQEEPKPCRRQDTQPGGGARRSPQGQGRRTPASGTPAPGGQQARACLDLAGR